jgi:hypothetical protein
LPERDLPAGDHSPVSKPGEATAPPIETDNLASASPHAAAVATTLAVTIYARSTTNAPFRQGEILTDVLQYRRSLASFRANTHELAETRHPFAIVISQDCDLERDYYARNPGPGEETSDAKLIPNIFVLEAVTVDELRLTSPKGKDIWKRIQQNKDERYHVLESVSAECDNLDGGIPALGVDFRRHFSVPTDELYAQCDVAAKRRCCLISPYLEHFTRRFADFLSRVALPRDHRID